ASGPWAPATSGPATSAATWSCAGSAAATSGTAACAVASTSPPTEPGRHAGPTQFLSFRPDSRTHMKRPMNLLSLGLAAVLPLAACNATPAEEALAEAGRAVEEARAEMSTVAVKVRREMDLGDIRFGGNHDSGLGDDEGAKITPGGGLLIDGEPVEVSAAERELLLAYREQIADIAVAGARVGLQ